MIVPETDQIILDKLWKFAKSEHFNEIYEEMIRKEAFIQQIKQGDNPTVGLSPFREFSLENINRINDHMRTDADRHALVEQLKQLVQILEDDADPYNTQSQNDIVEKIRTVKNAIAWM